MVEVRTSVVVILIERQVSITVIKERREVEVALREIIEEGAVQQL